MRNEHLFEFRNTGLACFVNYYRLKHFEGVLNMAELTIMSFEKGPGNNIWCRAINRWFKMDSYVSSMENLFLEIGKIQPDVVVMDLDLYAKIDGIETSRMIRLRFDVPVMYV